MQLSRRHLLDYGAALPALAILSACQLPGSGPPPREFRLMPKDTYSELLPTAAWSLGIGTPSADRSIDTNRIRLTSGVELENYAGAAWANRPAAMIQTLMLESFRNSGAIEIVVDERSDVRTDFVLRTDLRAFQAEKPRSGPPQVRAALDAKLVQMPKRNVIGSKAFDHTVAATSSDIGAVVMAFDEALGEALKRLVEWTLVTGETATQG